LGKAWIGLRKRASQLLGPDGRELDRGVFGHLLEAIGL
jgi:hypothetical protein